MPGDTLIRQHPLLFRIFWTIFHPAY
jgi:hypothetical protein